MFIWGSHSQKFKRQDALWFLFLVLGRSFSIPIRVQLLRFGPTFRGRKSAAGRFHIVFLGRGSIPVLQAIGGLF